MAMRELIFQCTKTLFLSNWLKGEFIVNHLLNNDGVWLNEQELILEQRKNCIFELLIKMQLCKTFKGHRKHFSQKL